MYALDTPALAVPLIITMTSCALGCCIAGFQHLTQRPVSHMHHDWGPYCMYPRAQHPTVRPQQVAYVRSHPYCKHFTTTQPHPYTPPPRTPFSLSLQVPLPLQPKTYTIPALPLHTCPLTHTLPVPLLHLSNSIRSPRRHTRVQYAVQCLTHSTRWPPSLPALSLDTTSPSPPRPQDEDEGTSATAACTYPFLTHAATPHPRIPHHLPLAPTLPRV